MNQHHAESGMEAGAALNQLILSGIVLELGRSGKTPGGIPYRYFTIEHRSRQIEAGMPREVLCRIRVDMRGAQFQALFESIQLGTPIQVTGFLARAGHRDEGAMRLVLHATDMRILAA